MALSRGFFPCRSIHNYWISLGFVCFNQYGNDIIYEVWHKLDFLTFY